MTFSYLDSKAEALTYEPKYSHYYPVLGDYDPSLVSDSNSDPCIDMESGFAIDHFESLHPLLLEELLDTGIRNFPDQGMISLEVEGQIQATIFLAPGQYGQMFGQMSDGRGVFVEINHCGHSYSVKSRVDENLTMHELLLQKAMSGETRWEDVDLFIEDLYPDSPVAHIAVVESKTGKILPGTFRVGETDHFHDFDILEESIFTSWWSGPGNYPTILTSYPALTDDLELLNSLKMQVDDETYFLIFIVKKVEP
ncbi:MAG: hypothetical protein HN365_04605 [Candidatus Pacebacteria bacterium]|nr:hypothetical protein [Candidatus Paceibacterota bacterium]MBT4005311.1 hypothetical protein [Candidatus Paceibacterota bacterium]MBT4680815.1 hypothetical protein [Candidatus Paceibacterota bacterium]MBT7499925.1 hypothetical protein [Candidatus Paceibacterota bacterium]